MELLRPSAALNGAPARRAAARGWLALFLLLAGVRLAPQLHAQAQAAAPLEYQVKAAFLLNFTKFVEWPAASFISADSSLRICIFGGDPFGSILDRTLEGETVNGRKVEATRLRQDGTFRTCHILFISRFERERTSQILPELRGSSVLSVGEAPGFIDAGGMIEFIIDEGKVRFYINSAATDAAGLKLSSRLLRVAKAVRGRQR
jgi:hypothetical protein